MQLSHIHISSIFQFQYLEAYALQFVALPVFVIDEIDRFSYPHVLLCEPLVHIRKSGVVTSKVVFHKINEEVMKERYPDRDENRKEII